MIYLDNAATTKPTKEVIEDINYALEKYWCNPSSTYEEGREVRRMVEYAREQVAKSINAEPEEIIFTSCGSESNNMAIKGYIEENNGIHGIITTKIEHPSVYNTCKEDLFINIRVDYVDVNYNGVVSLDALKDLIIKMIKYDGNVLVSIMMANNEIGTIQPIKQISEIVHKYGGVLHTDAVQAYGHIPIDVKEMGIDMMSVSGHKIGLPRGIGFLYKKKDISISPLIHGGSQEDNLRAGTENTAFIYALGNQIERINSVSISVERLKSNFIWEKIQCYCEEWGIKVSLNGHRECRLPNNLSLTFEGINAENLLTLMNLSGVCCSAGSACCSGNPEPSRILKAIGLSDEEAFSTIRVTVGEDTNFTECEKFIDILNKCLKRLKSN